MTIGDDLRQVITPEGTRTYLETLIHQKKGEFMLATLAGKRRATVLPLDRSAYSSTLRHEADHLAREGYEGLTFEWVRQPDRYIHPVNGAPYSACEFVAKW